MQIGKHNGKLIELRKATRRGVLTASGLLPIEGPILLEEAERSGTQIVDVFLRSGTPRPTVVGVSVYDLTDEIFKTLQSTEHSQGVIATVRLPEFNIKDTLTPSPALVIVLCRIQDPGNVGTILRVGEALGATGCLALRETASFHNGKLVRASAGSLFRLPHVGSLELTETVQDLRSRGVFIVGTAPTASSTIDVWDWQKPTALLVGNEGGGLNNAELHACDAVLRIPQKPTVESLNSAIATAVVLYEASKQRH